MAHKFDIELIDVNAEVENFTFEKVPQKQLDKLLDDFKEEKTYLEFSCYDGNILLERQYFRGVMYIPHIEKKKTVTQETMEDAKDIGKYELVNKPTKRKIIAKE